MEATTFEIENEIDIQPETKQNVVITGFGPFQGHPINASWEAVKLLPQMNIEGDLNVNLIVEQIPVTYDTVEKKIPDLWKKYNPLLMIHVGVSGLARNLTLERCARQSGYNRCDVDGQKPICSKCCFGSEDLIHSTLDILDLSVKINSMNDDVQTSVSTDAGRYLCEYIYYTSLNQDNSRSLFVHVPDLEKPYTSLQTATGLCKIIKELVPQVRIQDENKIVTRSS